MVTLLNCLMRTCRFKMLLSVFVVALTLLGCGEKATNNVDSVAAPKPKLSAVTLAASKKLWTSVALLAKAQGYFDQEGLSVTVSYQDGGRYCMDALISKSAEFATVVEVNVAYLGYTGNENVSVVGSIIESTSCGIVGRKSAGIEKPEDLKGKVLALSPGTGSELFAYKFLESHGLARSDVQLRKLQPKAIQGAIIAKEIDAAATWDPFIENSRRALGEDAFTFFDPKAYVGYMHVAVRRDWAEQHAPEVEAFLRALKRASDFIKSDPKHAQAILAKETAMNLDLVESIWKYFDFSLSLNPEKHLASIVSVGTFIKANEEAYKVRPLPDYSRYIDDKYLRHASAKYWRVTGSQRG